MSSPGTRNVRGTIDVCTRLGRYLLQELLGWKSTLGAVLATLVTVAVPALILTRSEPGEFMRFWTLFGASNQLLAGLTLLGVTVWLWRSRRVWWAWIVTGIPALLMYVMSSWALVSIIRVEFSKSGSAGSPVGWISVTLVGLAAVMLIEAVVAVTGGWQPPAAREPEPVAA